MAERIDNDTVAIPVERYNRWKEIVKGQRSGKTLYTVSHVRPDGTEIKEIDYKGKDEFISGIKADWNKWYTEVSTKLKELDTIKVDLANRKQEVSQLESNLSVKNQELSKVKGELEQLKEQYDSLIKMDTLSFAIMKRKRKKESKNGVSN